MPVKVLPAHVYLVRADLATVLDAETVQLVQPVWDGLAVPAERQLERVVDALLLFLLLFRGPVACGIRGRRRRVRLVEQLLLALARRKREAPLDVRLGLIESRDEGGKEGGRQVRQVRGVTQAEFCGR